MRKPIVQIIEHYDSYDESGRLTGGFGLLKFERTKELIARHLPKAPAVILDGGGDVYCAYHHRVPDLSEADHERIAMTGHFCFRVLTGR